MPAASAGPNHVDHPLPVDAAAVTARHLTNDGGTSPIPPAGYAYPPRFHAAPFRTDEDRVLTTGGPYGPAPSPAEAMSTVPGCGHLPGRSSWSDPAEGIAPYTRIVIFFFGLGTKQQHLGPGETRTCPRCHNTTQWTRMREFKQFTVFFVPVARWKRRQLETCGICGAVIEI